MGLTAGRGFTGQVQTLVDGVERQFQTVGNAQLVEDVVQVVLYRLLTDEHLLGHFLVLVTLGDQRHDFVIGMNFGRAANRADVRRR